MLLYSVSLRPRNTNAVTSQTPSHTQRPTLGKIRIGLELRISSPQREEERRGEGERERTGERERETGELYEPRPPVRPSAQAGGPDRSSPGCRGLGAQLGGAAPKVQRVQGAQPPGMRGVRGAAPLGIICIYIYI